MARQQVAGGIIVDQLRDRILSGMYLGQWHPGQRLPSIRDVADAEEVDRKTAAAAYRRLQKEGLVDVRARSGVYLKDDFRSDRGGPLQKLQRRWLESTYEGGHEIGLGTPAMIRLLGAVATVEKRAIPVIESDWSQAEVLAAELRERLGVRTVAVLASQLDPHDRFIADAPFFVTTPFQRHAVAQVAHERTVVQLILARDMLDQIAKSLDRGSVLIIAPSEEVAGKVRAGIERGLLPDRSGRARILVPGDPQRLLEAARSAPCVFLWPGTPGWVVRSLENIDCVIPGRCISEESLGIVRRAILDSAMRVLASGGNGAVNTSSGADTAPRPGVAAD